MSIREKTGPAALEQWARNATEGRYPGVSIKNMTTSWRNGLAFCALIHRFHPELIDFESLDPTDIRGNCTLAFDVAESKLGIPSLLDPEDFVTTEVPDRLSVLTYVAQIYNFLKNSHKTENKKFLTSPEKVGIKRPGSHIDSDTILELTRDTSPKRPVLLSSPTVCSVCQNPVYITERVLFAKKLFHRSCFRCTSCGCVLNPQTADYSPDGLFCLDKDCQKQFRQVNIRPSSRIVNNNNNNNTTSPKPPVKQNGDTIKMREGNDTTPTRSTMHTTIPESLSSVPSPILRLTKKEEEEIPSSSSSPLSPVESTEIEEQEKDSKDIPNSDIQESQVNLKDKNHIPQELNEETSSTQILSDTTDNSEENLVEDKNESRETVSQENSTVNELSEDRLNIEEVVEPEPQHHEKEKVRSVSFSAIVSVAKIEPIPESDSTSNTQLVDNDNLSNIENKDNIKPEEVEDRVEEMGKDKNQKEEIKIEEVKIIAPPSPKPKPKHAIDFLKENLETMSAQKNPFDEEEDDDDDAHKENNNTVEANYGDGATALEKSRDGELELEEKTSRNESGVGDSFESEMIKNDDIESGNVSGDEDHKLQISPVSTHDIIQRSKDTKEHTPNHTNKSILNESSDSLSGLEGQGEVKEETKPPVRRPRVPRPSSPGKAITNTTTTPQRPSPSPRKRTSTSELWKTKDYYPAELNPFESEDTFTLQPSDILVVKKASSHERIPPVSPFNPFEDDEDDEPEQQKQSIELLVPPKSPINSIKSVDSISNSGSVRSIKKRRAPLPPSMTPSPKTRQDKVTSRLEDLRTRAEDARRRPAPTPPNPNQISRPNNSSSPTMNEETSPKKIIPASPDLLKGLKSPNSVGSVRKKRRAPPPKRHVAALPEAAIKQELSDLAIKEKEFERQGINLEANIRRLMEEENENDSERVDEMVIQLWSIVNEKNDILRRQTELDYLRRGHRLEEQQAEVEFQLRVLMETPMDQRKEDQEETEEQLLQELLKLVDERAEVIEWLDRVTSEILVEPQIGEEDLHEKKSLSSFSSMSRSSPTSQNLVLPIKSETSASAEKTSMLDSIKFGKSKDTKDKNKEDGKGNKRDKFKLGFFSKKRKSSSKSSSKNNDEGKSNDESLKA